MKTEGILKFLFFYIIGVLLLLLSVFLSDHISYNGHFISDLPTVLPIVFSLISIGISVLFIFNRNYPWFFRTGMMSLISGITLSAFGIISFSFNVKAIVWGSSLGIGILFTIAAIVRLLIQGGLSAYRKIKA